MKPNDNQGPRALLSWGDLLGAFATFALLILVGYLLAVVVTG